MAESLMRKLRTRDYVFSTQNVWNGVKVKQD